MSLREDQYYNLYNRGYLSRAAAQEISMAAVARLGKVMGLSRGKTLKALGLKNNVGNRAWYDEITEEL